MKNINSLEKKSISIFSTYAFDKIIRDNGKTINEQLGGPLFFLKKALDDVGVTYTPFYGKIINTEILVSEKGEVGKVVDLPAKVPLPIINNDEWIIISTVLNEWDLSNLDKVENKICIDIQGYVRGKGFGEKVVWKNLQNYANNIFCLKGTKDEISYLPKSVCEDQKKRLLIITDKESGIEWFSNGKRYFLPVEKNEEYRETIGAGDIFFGYLIGSLSLEKALESAIKYAVKETEKFLDFKNKKREN